MSSEVGPTPYSELNEILRDLVSSVGVALGESFIGAYLQGSFAVGDFDRHSDVDFIVAVRDELTSAQVDVLQKIHRRVFARPSRWAQHLEGSYFPATVLRNRDQADKPLWYLDHGSLSLVNPDPAVAVRQPADPADFASTLQFVKFIIREVPGALRAARPK